MIIVLAGQDTYRSRERLKQLRDAFVQKYDPSGMNVSFLDSDGMNFERFQSAVTSQGFLSSRRFVVVERPFDLDTKTQNSISQFITDKGVPEESIVVFWIGEEKKKAKRGATEAADKSHLAATLKKAKTYETFDALEPNEVERWIVQFVKQNNGTIERPAVAHMAAAVGNDLWLASNELTKLLHQHGGTISLADAQASIAVTEEENIFALTDALSRKDERLSLQLLEQQLDSGANELYLLTMLLRQVRILLSVGDVAAQEPNPATIASRLKLHPFVTKKALSQIRIFSQTELLSMHSDLVTIDRKLKSTRENPRALLELAVIRACRRAV